MRRPREALAGSPWALVVWALAATACVAPVEAVTVPAPEPRAIDVPATDVPATDASPSATVGVRFPRPEVARYVGSVDPHDLDGDGVPAIAHGGADCADADPTVHPGASEVCNHVDDDCDGEIDEPGSTGERLWHADADGDGFGAADDALLACDSPDGYVADTRDCDDHSAAIHPGTPGCPWCRVPARGPLGSHIGYVDTADAVIVGDGGGFGHQVAVTDSNGDGCADVLVSAPSTGSDIAEVGAVYVFYGPVSGRLSIDDADAVIAGTVAHGRLGEGLAAVDLDSDDHGDLAVGSNGSVYLFEGPVSGAVGIDAATGALYSNAPGTSFGTVIAPGGDVNGDDFPDLVVGMPDDAVHDGSAWVVHGPVLGLHRIDDVAAAAVHGRGAGASVAVVDDVNGDGEVDLLVGGGDPDGGPTWGVAGIYFGPLAGEMTLPDDADIAYEGDDPAGTVFSIPYGTLGAGLGASVANVGDTDGDGISDYVIGAPGWEPVSHSGTTGMAWVYLGTDEPTGPATWFSTIHDGYTDVGSVVAPAGDVDGDGFDDFLVRSSDGECRLPDRGTVELLFGHPNRGLAQDPATYGTWGADGFSHRPWIRHGWYRGDAAGTAMAAGDVNGDGYSDVVITAPGFDAWPTRDAGVAYVFYGRPRTEPPAWGPTPGECAAAPASPIESNIDVCVLSTRPFSGWGPTDPERVDDHAGVVVDPADLDVLPSYVHPGLGHEACTFPYSYVFIQAEDGTVYEVRANRLLPATASFDVDDFAAIGIVDAPQTAYSAEASWALVDDVGLVAAASTGHPATWACNPYGHLLDVRPACGSSADGASRSFFVNRTVVRNQSTGTVPTRYGDVAFTAYGWSILTETMVTGEWFDFAARRR